MTNTRNGFGQPIGDALPNWIPCPPPPRTPIEGRLCRVEPLNTDRHADALFAAYAQAPDARDWTYLPDEPASDRDAFRARIAERAASSDPLHMAVICAEQVLGAAALMRIDRSNGVVELGHVHFAPALQRTAAATEAFFIIIRRVFDELGYRRLEWKCDSLNAPSRRTALRLGFSFEGIFRHAVVTKRRNRDTAWFAMIADDWPKARADLERWLAPQNFLADGRQIAKLASFKDGGA